MPSTSDIAEWVERYRQAWEDKDPAAAGALFSETASYRDHIFSEPHLNRAGVEQYWADITGPQSDITVRMGTPIVQDDKVMVEFWTTNLWEGQPATLTGAMILRFDEAGL